MRSLALAAGLAIISAAARGDDAIPPETVDGVKKATVFLRVQGTNWKATGSGFVVAADKDSVLVATNFHVIAPPGAEKRPHPTPSELAKYLKVPAVTAVFDGGTKTELAAKAEAVAADPEADLAIVRVTGLKAPPAPIDVAASPKLSETMAVYTFGFPFGQALATGKGAAPAVTVGKGSVSSLRNDETGELVLVQIDGALNPGNSGGPVVDAKGKLVGVAVATIKNGQGIGFAVPAAELGRVMKGRVGGMHFAAVKTGDGKVTVRAEVGLVDPAAAVRGVTLHYLVAPRGKADRTQPLEKQPGAKTLALKAEGNVAAGEFALDSAAGDLLVQAVPDGGLGAAGLTRVRTFPLVLSKTPPTPRTGGGSVTPKAPNRGPRIQGGGADPEFRDHAPEGGLLVGLEVGLGKFFDKDIIKAVRPVYRVGDKEVLGEQFGTDTSRVVRLVARPGYAVGAANLRTGLLIDDLSLTFMKAADGKLDPRDGYESERLGTPGNRPVRIGADGVPVVGILGKANPKDVTGLGLVFADTAKLNAPWPAGKPTKIQGGGDTEFRDAAPAGGLLVGLEVGLGKFFDNDIVKAVRPVYRVGTKEVPGEQYGVELNRVTKLVAKPGYAIGAITLKTGLGVDGVSVTFMKAADGKLDPRDSYESEWVGGKGGGGPVTLSGDGTPVVGLAGRTNPKDVAGLGLLLKDKAAGKK